MPTYRFTGSHETVMHGLSHGVNATLHRDSHGQPDGSTLVALPGDEITTTDLYLHAHMRELKRKPSKPTPSAEGQE
jgi:hypothetical protein